MASEQPKRRFLSMLRRTAKSATAGGRSAVDENALWASHDRAVASTKEASAAAQRISSTASRQRAASEAAADRTRAVVGRAQEAVANLARLGEAFERLGLIALNAGLEGARLGETAGRGLVLVSDEVRMLSARGLDTSRDAASAAGDVVRELGQLGDLFAQARDATAELTHDAARAASASAEAEAALVELNDRVRKSTGSDPETVRAIAEAGENARALVASLTALTGKVPRGLLVGALRPVLDPLARLLADDDGDEGGEDKP
jgi:methyl-accepting chemotaxis protein